MGLDGGVEQSDPPTNRSTRMAACVCGFILRHRFCRARVVDSIICKTMPVGSAESVRLANAARAIMHGTNATINDEPKQKKLLTKSSGTCAQCLP